MKIYNTKTLEEIQQEFNKIFSYLKIEFFNRPHQIGIYSEESHRLDPYLMVGEVRSIDTVGVMPMSGDIQVGVFEKIFEERFGLFVQVYRKSHGRWLQTWASDIWTLEEQNNRSRILGNTDDLLVS